MMVDTRDLVQRQKKAFEERKKLRSDKFNEALQKQQKEATRTQIKHKRTSTRKAQFQAPVFNAKGQQISTRLVRVKLAKTNFEGNLKDAIDRAYRRGIYSPKTKIVATAGGNKSAIVPASLPTSPFHTVTINRKNFASTVRPLQQAKLNALRLTAQFKAKKDMNKLIERMNDNKLYVTPTIEELNRAYDFNTIKNIQKSIPSDLITVKKPSFRGKLKKIIGLQNKEAGMNFIVHTISRGRLKNLKEAYQYNPKVYNEAVNIGVSFGLGYATPLAIRGLSSLGKYVPEFVRSTKAFKFLSPKLAPALGLTGLGLYGTTTYKDLREANTLTDKSIYIAREALLTIGPWGFGFKMAKKPLDALHLKAKLDARIAKLPPNKRAELDELFKLAKTIKSDKVYNPRFSDMEYFRKHPDQAKVLKRYLRQHPEIILGGSESVRTQLKKGFLSEARMPQDADLYAPNGSEKGHIKTLVTNFKKAGAKNIKIEKEGGISIDGIHVVGIHNYNRFGQMAQQVHGLWGLLPRSFYTVSSPNGITLLNHNLQAHRKLVGAFLERRKLKDIKKDLKDFFVIARNSLNQRQYTPRDMLDSGELDLNLLRSGKLPDYMRPKVDFPMKKPTKSFETPPQEILAYSVKKYNDLRNKITSADLKFINTLMFEQTKYPPKHSKRKGALFDFTRSYTLEPDYLSQSPFYVPQIKGRLIPSSVIGKGHIQIPPHQVSPSTVAHEMIHSLDPSVHTQFYRQAFFARFGLIYKKDQTKKYLDQLATVAPKIVKHIKTVYPKHHWYAESLAWTTEVNSKIFRTSKLPVFVHARRLLSYASGLADPSWSKYINRFNLKIPKAKLNKRLVTDYRKNVKLADIAYTFPLKARTSRFSSPSKYKDLGKPFRPSFTGTSDYKPTPIIPTPSTYLIPTTNRNTTINRNFLTPSYTFRYGGNRYPVYTTSGTSTTTTTRTPTSQKTKITPHKTRFLKPAPSKPSYTPIVQNRATHHYYNTKRSAYEQGKRLVDSSSATHFQIRSAPIYPNKPPTHYGNSHKFSLSGNHYKEKKEFQSDLIAEVFKRR